LYQDNFKKVLISETEVTCNNNRTDIVEQIQEKHLQPQSSLEKSELLSDKSLVDEDINDETGSFDVIINKKEPKRGVKRRLTDDSDCLEAKVLDIHKPVVETTIEIKSEHLIQSTSETKLKEGTEKVFTMLFQSTYILKIIHLIFLFSSKNLQLRNFNKATLQQMKLLQLMILHFRFKPKVMILIIRLLRFAKAGKIQQNQGERSV